MTGVCRHCRCTEEDPCILSTGDACWWTNDDRTACSNPLCIKAEQRRLRAEQEIKREEEKAARRKHGDRFVNMGFGAIIEELRKDERRKRRKRRAA